MNRYNCTIILPEGAKEIKIHADSVHPDSTCATRFHRRVKIMGDYGVPETGFELVAQYPTDKLIIESIDYKINDKL